MNKEDIDIIQKFLHGFQKETDRGTALIGAAMVESRLERILKHHLIENNSSKELLNGPNAPLGTFSAKSKFCHALGLITEKEFTELNYIRKIRNIFAHTFKNTTFSDHPVSDLCLKLNADTPGDFKSEKKYRELFVNSVVLVSLSLWYRPEYAREQEASVSNWEYSL